MCLAIASTATTSGSFLLALINVLRVRTILDGRELGHCGDYVLDSGATLGLADARGYRCRNKGNVVVRCGDYRPVPRDPRARELFGSEPSSSRAVRKRAGALRSC